MERSIRRTRPALLPGVSLLAGVAIGHGVGGWAAEWVWPASAVATLSWVAYRHSLTRTSVGGMVVAVLLLGASLEARSRDGHLAAVDRLFPGTTTVRETEFRGRLEAPIEFDWEGRAWLRLRGSPPPPEESPRHGWVIRLRVTSQEGAASERLRALVPGDLVHVWCRIRRPFPVVGAASFDPMTTLRFRGLHATGTIKSDRLIERIQARPVPPVEQARRFVARRLDEIFAGRPEPRALAGAVLIGERARLGPTERRLLRDAGLLHLVAISGLHVGLLFWTLHSGLRRTPLGRWMRLGIVVALLVAFCAGVGARPSVLRAAGATGLLLFGRCLGREGDSLNGLVLLAATLVVIEPALLWGPGFQLTFTATAGILMLSGPLADAFGWRAPMLRGFAVSIAAYLATAPIVAWHFQWLSPVGLISNVAALPLCALLLLSGFGAVLASPLPALSAGLGWLALHAASGLIELGNRAAGWNGAAFCVVRPEPWLVALYYSALTCLSSVFSRLTPRGLPACRCLLLLAAIVLHLGPLPPRASGTLEAMILDVGQGLSVVLYGPQGAPILIDAGGSSNGNYDPGERIVLPHLLRHGGRFVKAMIVTHDHIDHVGGAFAVLRGLEVGELWLGPDSDASPRLTALRQLARERGTAVGLAEAGRDVVIAGVPLHFLAPTRRSIATTNDRSIVVLAGRAPSRLFVAGDLERRGETSLLATRRSLRAELLVVAHHGSRHGTGDSFLARVRPEIAVVSVGRGNRFGHPHPEVARRLRRAGVALLRTDTLGSIPLRATPRGWAPLPRVMLRRSAPG